MLTVGDLIDVLVDLPRYRKVVVGRLRKRDIEETWHAIDAYLVYPQPTGDNGDESQVAIVYDPKEGETRSRIVSTPSPSGIVYTESGLVYTPFISEDGRVGYAITEPENPDGVEEFIYFNPSTGPDDRNVFVYLGGDNDPGLDEPQVYVNVAEWDKEGESE